MWLALGRVNIKSNMVDNNNKQVQNSLKSLYTEYYKNKETLKEL